MESNDILAVAGGIIAGAVFLNRQNTNLGVTRYVYSNPKIPKAFSGFKILQVSDYHNYRVLEDKIISYAKAENPDIIAITGDLFDCRRDDNTTDTLPGLSLAQRLASICKVYFVSGNHEARIKNFEKVAASLDETGVTLMDNGKIQLERNGEFISLVGIRDPRFFGHEKITCRDKTTFKNKLISLCENDGNFKLLLSHRPEFIHTYNSRGVDLALTGHTHGGQFGIPFTDIGLYVPSQGFLPKYARGMKKFKTTTEIISRGIGKSSFPFRLFNPPEIVTVEFEV